MCHFDLSVSVFYTISVFIVEVSAELDELFLETGAHHFIEIKL